jgi:hypothetical protein
MAASREGWRAAVAAEWAERREAENEELKRREGGKPLFPLAANPFGEEEILAMTDVLLSGRLTLGRNVEVRPLPSLLFFSLFTHALVLALTPCRHRTHASSPPSRT